MYRALGSSKMFSEESTEPCTVISYWSVSKINSLSRKLSGSEKYLCFNTRLLTAPFLKHFIVLWSWKFMHLHLTHYLYRACNCSLRNRRLKGKGKAVLGKGVLGARETGGACVASLQAFPSSLLPHAWSRALIPFPFPFERLPRRLMQLSQLRAK